MWPLYVYTKNYISFDISSFLKNVFWKVFSLDPPYKHVYVCMCTYIHIYIHVYLFKFVYRKCFFEYAHKTYMNTCTETHLKFMYIINCIVIISEMWTMIAKTCELWNTNSIHVLSKYVFEEILLPYLETGKGWWHPVVDNAFQ